MNGSGTQRAASSRGSGPALALDIGGTKLAAALVGRDGSTSGVLVEPTRREEGWPAVVDRLFALGRRALADAGVPRVSAVGIACGGPLDVDTGTLLSPPHLPGWNDVPIGPLAAHAFGAPFALQNDATACALAEFRFGAGRGTSTMLYLTVSTGIGGGAVVDGRLHLGATGNASEFGHLTVLRGGRECSCGRLGCVEAYSSGTSIAARATELVACGESTVLSRLDRITAADVSKAAAAGDGVARAVWDESVEMLGTAVTDLVNVFEPDLVVLGGGVTRAGAMLLEPIRAQVAREAMRPAAEAARIALAGLGDRVGVVGAGAVAHEFAHRPPLAPATPLHA
jgi:glucokinase